MSGLSWYRGTRRICTIELSPSLCASYSLVEDRPGNLSAFQGKDFGAGSEGNSVNPFDAGIIHFFNQFARHSSTFDNIVVLISGNDFIKGGVMMSLLWWMWFREGGGREQTRRREIVLFGLFSSFAGLIVARFFAHVLPFRERPLHNPDVCFQMPYGMDEKTLIHWSSFPSDHAVLFFALAATIFFVSKRAGLLALCH